MAKLSEEDKIHFIRTAKKAPLGNDGRVFVGTNRLNGKLLREYLGELLYPHATSNDRTYVGSGGCDYYLRREKWIKLFGIENYPTKRAKTTNKVAAKKVAKKRVAKTKLIDVRSPVARTLAQAHAAAKESAGKKVVLSDGKVAELDDSVYTSYSWQDVEETLGTDKSRYLPVDIAIAKKIFAAGLPVIWTYADHTAFYRFVGFNGEFGEFNLAPEPIVVNGYAGKAVGDYWNFGCANISVEDLLLARNFLRDAKNTASKSKKVNRTIKCVYIGDGCFTLDILERMNLG